MLWLLGRHGETIDNKAGLFTGQLPGKLTSRGRAQARTLGSLIKLLQPDEIIASDLRRAYETASLAAAVCGYEMSVTQLDFLREISFGQCDGKHLSDIRHMSGLADLDYYDLRYVNDCPERRDLVSRFGLESLDHIQSRRDQILTSVRQRAAANGHCLVTVSHSTNNAFLVEGALYGTCGEKITLRTDDNHDGLYHQHNDEVTLLDVGSAGLITPTYVNIPILDLIADLL